MSRRHLILCSAIVCILIFAAAACSKSNSGSIFSSNPASTPTPEPVAAIGSGPATAPVSHPCSLLAQPEVESVLGKGATLTAYSNPRTGMDECKLKPGAANLDELVIIVHETTPESWLMMKKGFMQDKKVKQVRGLGDDAINVGGFAGIFARKGTRYVQIFGSLKPERDEKAELYLLQQAISRL